jgi:hypothetical protein
MNLNIKGKNKPPDINDPINTVSIKEKIPNNSIPKK